MLQLIVASFLVVRRFTVDHWQLVVAIGAIGLSWYTFYAQNQVVVRGLVAASTVTILPTEEAGVRRLVWRTSVINSGNRAFIISGAAFYERPKEADCNSDELLSVHAAMNIVAYQPQGPFGARVVPSGAVEMIEMSFEGLSGDRRVERTGCLYLQGYDFHGEARVGQPVSFRYFDDTIVVDDLEGPVVFMN